MRLPGKMFWPYVIVCVIFCIAGAVNSGWSQYFLAIPFALLLMWLITKRLSWIGVVLVLPFMADCVFVSDQRDHFQFLYPGLGGRLTFTAEHCLTEHAASQYGKAFRMVSQSCESLISGESLIKVIASGATYQVEAISHSYADMGDQVYPMIRVSGELLEARGAYVVDTALRSDWAIYLGLLMVCALPLLVLSSIYSTL